MRRTSRPAAPSSLAPLLLALSALLAPGCGEPPPPAPLLLPPPTVHDLVAKLPEARAEGTSMYRVQRLPIQPDADPRPVDAHLRLRTGAALVFDELLTDAEPVLRFTPGVGSTKDGAPAGPVRLVVSGTRRAPDGAEQHHALLELLVDPAQLDRHGLAPPVDLALPGDGPARWTLRFASEALPDAPPASWLGLFGPVLRSRWTGPPAPRPVELEHLHRDLLAALPEATALEEPHAGAVARTTLDAAEGFAGVGGRRACLRLPAPARVAWRLTVPADAELLFDHGVDTATGWQLPGDGTTFAVQVDGADVWSAHLDAHQLRRDRGWKPARVDLAPWAGREIELAVASRPGDDARNDTAAFADLRVVTPRRVRRLAAHEAPTVVLVVVDTLRADHVTRPLMPATLALADEGLRFTNARSSSSWTWPATASLLTGLPPTTHGVVGAHSSYVDDGLTTLAERFREAGYTTGAFVANLIVGAADNFDQGFETFVHLPNARGRMLNARLAHWLENTAGTARFVYLHYYDPHAPYLPVGDEAAVAAAERDTERLAQLWEQKQAGAVDDALAAEWADGLASRYAAEVRDMDAVLAELLALLEPALPADALIAVTSDHGEEFLDHGQVSHGPQLYEETLAAPLILAGRGALALPPAVLDLPVETRALPGTLLELVGLAPLPGDQRRLPLRAQGFREAPSFAQTLHGIEPGEPERVEKRAVVLSGAKLIHTPVSDRVELYDLGADPGETRDLAAEEPRRAATLRRLLDDWIAATRTERGERALVDEAAAERLRELGYLGDDPAEGR